MYRVGFVRPLLRADTLARAVDALVVRIADRGRRLALRADSLARHIAFGGRAGILRRMAFRGRFRFGGRLRFQDRLRLRGWFRLWGGVLAPQSRASGLRLPLGRQVEAGVLDVGQVRRDRGEAFLDELEIDEGPGHAVGQPDITK